MKLIKKIAQTPLDAIAKVINSWASGDDKTKNAPSIKLVSDKFESIEGDLADVESISADSQQNIGLLWDNIERIDTDIENVQTTKSNKLVIYRKVIDYSYYNSGSTIEAWNTSVVLPAGTYIMFHCGTWDCGDLAFSAGTSPSSGSFTFNLKDGSTVISTRRNSVITGRASMGISDTDIIRLSAQKTLTIQYSLASLVSNARTATLATTVYFIKIRDDVAITDL